MLKSIISIMETAINNKYGAVGDMCSLVCDRGLCQNFTECCDCLLYDYKNGEIFLKELKTLIKEHK